jgi:hypothetical protein
MNIVFENSNIVIIAKDFNPSIFKPLWLMKNGIFREEELQGNIVIAPITVQVPTKNFQFVVLPDRLQMLIHRHYPDVESDITRVVGGTVKTLPHTPYTAMGLNFTYIIAPEAEDAFDAWNRNLFASPLSNKILSSKETNARFGSYISFNVLETRLKIDIKPVKAVGNLETLCKSWHTGQDLVRVNFNFHIDVLNTDSPVDSVLKNLGKWTEALTLSQKLIAMIPE